MEYVERKRILLFGLPWTFTRYTVSDDLLNVRSGLFNTTEHDCYMYKVQDVQLEVSLFERIFHLGTVVCFTGDTTHPELRLIHIRRAREIKNFVLDVSEKARVKRRTLHTLDIGEGGMTEEDDF